MMVLRPTLWRWLIIALLALLPACSSLTKPGGESVPVVAPPEAPTTVPPTPDRETHRPASPSASAAWRPLLDKARAAADRGDYEQALALLERAQRIDPDSAEVYLGLARTHQARGDSVQARATAERGLLYCTTDSQCNALRGYVH